MISYVFFCIGGLLSFAGIILAVMNFIFLSRAETATGQVIGSDDSGSSEEAGNELSTSIIRFTTKNGQQIEFKALEYAWLSLIEDLLLGSDTSKVPVVYDPQNPKRAKVKKIFNLHLLPILLIVGGIIVFVGGFVPSLALRLLQN